MYLDSVSGWNLRMVSLTIFFLGVTLGSFVGVGCMFLILGRAGRDWFFGVGLNAKDIVINSLDGAAQRVVLNMRGIPVFIGEVATLSLNHSFFDSTLQIEVRQYVPRHRPGNSMVSGSEPYPPDPYLITPSVSRVSPEVELVPSGDVLPDDYPRTS
jgi:hypothetical protein